MRQDYDEFRSREAEVVAIVAKDARRLAEHWQRESIPFPALPDPRKRVLRPLGQQFKILKFGRMPALILVDKDGNVRYSHYGSSAKDIPANPLMLDLLDRLNTERSTSQTRPTG